MSRSPEEADSERPSDAYIKAVTALNLMVHEGRSFSGRERHCCFLNIGGPQFANVSGLSGMDFPEDGRALAVSDWDFDGDLDLWITNRTAPQVRFLRNNSPGEGKFLAVRLQGTSCNRDAIGARVVLVVSGDRPRRMAQTIRAGDAFLSQSSKWVHFGLGGADRVERLVVRWPSGTVEEFTDVQPGGWYQLIQGDRPRPWRPARLTAELKPQQLRPSPVSDRARTVLLSNPFLPSLDYRDWQGSKVAVAPHSHRPLLVNLWATWCGPCRSELAELQQQAELIRAEELDVLALCVDRPGDAGARDPQEMLNELKFNFPSGRADEQLVGVLDALTAFSAGTKTANAASNQLPDRS